jgi:hypothetical protein
LDYQAKYSEQLDSVIGWLADARSTQNASSVVSMKDLRW